MQAAIRKVDSFMALCCSPFSFGHCIFCSSKSYDFWLPLWYLQPFLRYTASDYLFGIFNLFLDIRPLIISLVSSNFSKTYSLLLPLWYIQPFLRHTASCYLFPLFNHFLDIRLWLPLWYLQTFLRHTASYYLFWRDTVSAGRRHTNGYELCPSSSRFIFILIWVGVSSKACKR
jgi:hypothetical protein